MYVIKYECPHCSRSYDTETKAIECCTSVPKTLVCDTCGEEPPDCTCDSGRRYSIKDTVHPANGQFQKIRDLTDAHGLIPGWIEIGHWNGDDFDCKMGVHVDTLEILP